MRSPAYPAAKGSPPMNFPRRTFLRSLSAAFFAAVFGKVKAQDHLPDDPAQASPPGPSRDVPRPDPNYPLRGTPYEAIENAASVMKAGDSDSVRGTVEALFKFPNGYRMPPV